jgi:hypothetical protein
MGSWLCQAGCFDSAQAAQQGAGHVNSTFDMWYGTDFCGPLVGEALCDGCLSGLSVYGSLCHSTEYNLNAKGQSFNPWVPGLPLLSIAS